jgi:hypothetical protein
MVDVTAGSLTYEFRATTTGLQAGLRSAQDQLRRFNDDVRRNSEQFTRMGRDAQRAVGLTRSELVNLSRQIQDVGVPLVSGQSPFMVMVQQGAQIADIFSSSRSGGAGAALKGFASQLASVVTPARVAATAGAAAFATIAAAAISATTSAAALSDTVKVLGTSFAGLRGLNQKGEVFGLDAKTMNSEMVGLAQRLSEAARSGGDLAKFMQANGIAIKDANGQARPFREVFAEIARLIGNSGTELDKLNALKLLGLSNEFRRVFEEGGAAVEKFATDTGGAIDQVGEETARRYRELKDGLLSTWASFSDGVINYLSNVKTYLLDVANAVQSAFFQVLRKIEEVIAGGRRALGMATGGLAGSTSEQYRGDLEGIAKRRLNDLLINERINERLKDRSDRLSGTGAPVAASSGGSIAFPPKGKEHKQAQDAIKNYIESLRVAEETAKADVENWKLGNVEREKAVALAKAESIAKREGKTLTESQRAAITDAAASTGRYRDKLEELRETQQRLNAAVREFQGAITNALEDIIFRGGKAKDVLASLAKELASSGLRQGLNSILGGDTGGKSQGGGLFGLLGGLFGGGGKGLFSGSSFKLNLPFFAEGGTLGAGKWGIAGEAGPELIHGPATITPMGSGGSQNIAVHNYAAGVDVTPQITPQGVQIMITSALQGFSKQLAEAPRRANR